MNITRAASQMLAHAKALNPLLGFWAPPFTPWKLSWHMKVIKIHSILLHVDNNLRQYQPWRHNEPHSSTFLLDEKWFPQSSAFPLKLTLQYLKGRVSIQMLTNILAVQYLLFKSNTWQHVLKNSVTLLDWTFDKSRESKGEKWQVSEQLHISTMSCLSAVLLS